MRRKKSSFIAIHEGNRWRKLGKTIQKGIPFHIKSATIDEIVYLEQVDDAKYNGISSNGEVLELTLASLGKHS